MGLPGTEPKSTEPVSHVTTQPNITQAEDKLFVKAYRVQKSTAKFVPRQVVKVSTHLTDTIADTLRRNAVTLRAQEAGPHLPNAEREEHERCQKLKRRDPGIERTMFNIREKVRQVRNTTCTLYLTLYNSN